MSQAMVTVEQLRQFCRQAVMLMGAGDKYASSVADAMAMTDSWGVFTHGSKLLYDYLLRVEAGGIHVNEWPAIVREGPAWAVVNANAVMGHVAGEFAIKTAIAKARQCGVGYVNVRNTNHFGAAGYYSWLAANQGFLGIAMSNDIPSVAAPGSKKAVTGSNPLSYAIPTGRDKDPILLDMAISTVAGGKVYAAHQRGEAIPDNWIIDSEGRPTTDSSLYPQEAALQPMSGPKGYGIALLIETLSGVLSGASITWQVGGFILGDKSIPTNHGAAFIVIDIDSIMARDEFEQRIDHLVDEIHNAPSVDDVERLMLPGEREWAHRADSLRHGIALPSDVVAKLKKTSALTGHAPAWLASL